MSSNLSTRTTHVHGDEREMESGLIFNQLICEFESSHPCQDILDLRLPIYQLRLSSRESNRQSKLGNRQFSVWVVAQLAEHRTVTAAREGSTPFGPPNFKH